MAHLQVSCPHCEGHIKIDLSVDVVIPKEYQTKGPKPHEYPQEVYDFVIEAIEVWDSPYPSVGKKLRERGVRTPTGKIKWHAASVLRLYESALERKKTETPNPN